MRNLFRKMRRKRVILGLITVSFTVFLVGMMGTSQEFQRYSSKIMYQSIGNQHLQNILTATKLPPANEREVNNVREIRNIIPEVKPRVVKQPETRLFRRETDKLIKEIQTTNLSDWKDKHCEGNLLRFGNMFILMKNVIIDHSKKSSIAVGGEAIDSVIGHTESDEEVTIQNGFFNLLCRKMPEIHFSKRLHRYGWYQSIVTRADLIDKSVETDRHPLTVLIRRGDYANAYWTLVDLYNTYMTIRLLNKNPQTTKVILMDAHPKGQLDDLWSVLFGNVERIGHITSKRFYYQLAWVATNGPMENYIQNIPFVEEFKYALYQATNISFPLLYHNYSNTPVATFIQRRDYVAHPRNPSGKIKRKLSNEKEIIEHLKSKLPGVDIIAIQLDALPIREQIERIYNSSVLIGVHGAGLAYTILLRSGSAMIELFPSSYKFSPNSHFQEFAFWADVHYDRWYSTSMPVKGDEWLYVNPDVPLNLVQHALNRTCFQTT